MLTPEDIRRKADKSGAKTEADRVGAERDALIAGLTTEVSRVYTKLEECEDKLVSLALAIKKQGAEIRALERRLDGASVEYVPRRKRREP